MLGWMQPDGNRRPLCSRAESSVGPSPRSRGRVDEEPRESRSPRGRRATTLERQGRDGGGRSPKGGSKARGSPTGEEEVSERGFKLWQQVQEEEVEKEEKEEGEEGEGLKVNGEAPQLCSSKRARCAFQRDRVGRQGEGQEACGAQGQALCIEEKEVSQQLLGQLGSFRQFQPCRGYPSGWRFLRRFACKRHRRTLSWSLDVGGPTEDGGESPDPSGREHGGRCCPSGSHSILQTTATEEGLPSGGEGAVDHCSGLGPDRQRNAGTGNRYPGPASQVSGGCFRRSSLVGGSEDGASTIRRSSLGRGPRAETCSARELREQQVPLLCFESHRKRERQQSRERREGWEEQGREGQGGQGPQRGQGKEEVEAKKDEEGIREYEDSLLVEKVTDEVQAPRARDELSGVAAGQVGVVRLPIGGRDNVSPCVAEGATAGMQDFLLGIPPTSGKKSAFECELHGMVQGVTLTGLGNPILQRLLEVCLLRSKSTGIGEGQCLFPLPTSSSTLQKVFPNLSSDEVAWLCCLAISLNSMWGGSLFNGKSPSKIQRGCLDELKKDVARLRLLKEECEDFEWDVFFKTRSIDYQGDEVKIAMSFQWENICPALPKEVGVVPLADVCKLGARHYVENFELYLKDREHWELVKAPKVMVSDEHWPDVCEGLVKAKVCTYITLEEVFDTGQGPLLNGLFGVSKDETIGGYDVYRLIMNLIPLNGLCQPLGGDVDTLPAWSSMSPFFLQPGESLLVSSEDVRCFFYVMSLPPAWYKFLAFNKLVPQYILPPHLKGKQVFLASRVLPMGFLNSVLLAQHVHRNLVLWSSADSPSAVEPINPAEAELRKDKHFPTGDRLWRVYLDNYDLLEKVEATQVTSLSGTLAAPVLALRNQYEVWDVPRNTKKSVVRSTVAEVQGAIIDGESGIAFPKEGKLLKYLTAGLKLCSQQWVTQRQLQVVCGGLVYMAMFRRPLLGSLNAVWRMIESFSECSQHHQKLWPECRFEIVRFISMLPLARMDFRQGVHPQVTCSDASTSGGGVCASTSLTAFGASVSRGALRGQVAEDRSELRVLSVGLFDGIGALRVALDLIEADVLGHVAVEQSKEATRVVESAFPNILKVEDVALVDSAMVKGWALKFSQASLVILGAGPPCQGVSGLNASRKGALRDLRSVLYKHVKRIEGLVRIHFPWCQVHSLMESVASMDEADCQVMTEDFGHCPWKCDSGLMTWCSRPRFYWVTWDLNEGEGVSFVSGGSYFNQVELSAWHDLVEVCQDGWEKVDTSRPFPTLTTSRPRATAGHKPAGIQSCQDHEIKRWTLDDFRFPPYQYKDCNGLVNKKGEVRVPSVEEREILLGFPLNYTFPCLPKGQRRGTLHRDTRLSLLGNSWSVPVVAWFLSQLLRPLGLCREWTPQQVMDALHPSEGEMVQHKLFRQPLRHCKPLLSCPLPVEAERLVFKLSNLVSIKGEDILLTSSASEQAKFHRLRASVPSKLWKWKTISGWKWKHKGDHINVLELRAILTALRWRVEHKNHFHSRLIHLTDSLVCLHALTRGRSSSRKLRRTLCRINALLLASSNHVLWAYVHTDQNPADRPSRWSSKVKTKYRNA